MIKDTRPYRLGLVSTLLVALVTLSPRPTPLALGGDRPDIDQARLERTRTTIRMLDDLYKGAVVAVTANYVTEQAETPAAAVAKQIFDHMKSKGWHAARLVDATGKPKNKANLPQTEFERTAVAKLRAGATYYEEIAEVDGKPVLRAATVVPAVMQQCVICHGRKQGSLLGAIIYEVPIR